jgi:tartrate dehydratase beta subunit/fumarate hydratase class I family protein
MTKLSFPFTEEEIRALKVGDEVLISGVIHPGTQNARLKQRWICGINKP